jgi:hypothetical protein
VRAAATTTSGAVWLPAADRIPAIDPDTGSYEVIHLGGQAAVVVPVSDFLRLDLGTAYDTTRMVQASDEAVARDERWVQRDGRPCVEFSWRATMSAIRPAAVVGQYWRRTARCADAFLPPWRRLRPHCGPRGGRRPSLSILHLAGRWYGEPVASR